MSKTQWTAEQMPNQSGRVAIVTGANSGIGFETAVALAAHGAKVVLACRSEQKGNDAVRSIREKNAEADVSFGQLDLSSLSSVEQFSEAMSAAHSKVDLLINNAGVMMPPEYTKTEDGFELQFGTNHLGHFALTHRLMPLLLKAPASRVVNVSSMAHRSGKMDFDDLDWKSRRYKKMATYGQSKLANLLFTLELQRRLSAASAPTAAMASHPGWTGTNLQRHSGWIEALNPLFSMEPWQGALPSLYAATAAEAVAGEYYGPNGFMEVRGYPGVAYRTPAAKNEADAQRLWEASERATGLTFTIGAAEARSAA